MKGVTMFPRITKVQHINGYILELTFANGVSGRLDFAPKIVGRGGMFTPLQEIPYFKQVQVDPEAGTLIWPNGLDLDPDVLYSEVTGEPIKVAALAHEF
jgi:hypothetical protein